MIRLAAWTFGRFGLWAFVLSGNGLPAVESECSSQQPICSIIVLQEDAYCCFDFIKPYAFAYFNAHFMA
jgi:hypothetical protein